ncbi:MAG TPA: NrdH-redoxin [Pseudomonadales bacterium]
MRQSILALLLCLLAMPLMAGNTAAGVQPATVLQVFVRDGCPHCDKAKAYLPALAGRYPQLEIVLRPVDGDPQNHRDWLQYSFRAGIWPAGVPAFVVADNMLLGFASAAETGPQLAALIEGRAVQQERLHNRWLGELSVSRLGLPLFTLAIGLLDGFNPCAMWVLLFLLSMLVHLQDRLRMALIAGCFVLVSALVYYAFMAAWLQLFLAVGISNTVRYLLVLLALLIGLANVRDYVAPGRRFTLSIPASAKPGMYARMRAIVRADNLALSLAGAALLAVLVNMIELLCTAGFPAMYTAILTAQQLDAASHYAYLALYIVAYMTDDALMVTLAVLALGSRKLDERAGRRLKLLSGLVMLALAAVMLLFPGLLL